MLKKITFKKIFWGFVILLIVIQVFRINKTNPELQSELDIAQQTNMPENLHATLKKACYDCHSNEVKYPWYTNIAPVSWWIKHHINEGSHHLNFSDWGNYKERRKDKKLKECAEMLEANEMPLSSYLWMHSEAQLSSEEKSQLIAWFYSQRTFESDKPKEN